MKTIIYIALFCLGSVAIKVEAKSVNLVYHQNAESKKVSGSKEKLISAVREGKKIRIYMNLGFVEHAMDAGFLSIFKGHVYAQINTIQGQRPNGKTNEIELKPYTKHVGLYSTKSPYEMKWYVYE